jgi:hypothetical protein
MSSPSLPESELLKELLQPLLEDFQYWFSRTRTLLESEAMPFLNPDEQAERLAQIVQVQEQVQAAQGMFYALEGQVGLDPAILMTWHRQVSDCWQLLMRWRLSRTTAHDS